jgi:hypothetical protein
MKYFLIVISLIGGSFMILQDLPEEVLTQSLESKTITGSAVFNKIALKTNNQQDIWEMRQSHHGLKGDDIKWDHLKIIVDKTTTPYSVSYHQLENNKEVDYKVSCFLCHANGPRAIRADFNSKHVRMSIQDKLQIYLWNFKIKSYGQVVLKKDLLKRKTPLKWTEGHFNQRLNVPTCLKCHNDEGGLFSRGALLRQHFMSIQYLVDNKEMPPWPYKLPEKERMKIDLFLKNF